MLNAVSTAVTNTGVVRAGSYHPRTSRSGSGPRSWKGPKW